MRRFPAEWEPHEATLLTWPWDGEIWGDAHDGACRAIAESAAVLSQGERVEIHVPDAATEKRAREWIAQASLAARAERIQFVILASDDVWVRDHGPTVVLAGSKRLAIDWNFNAWGGKFPHAADQKIAAAVAERWSMGREQAPIILEGGALESDGRGHLLCTRSVALAANRNPAWSEAALDELFMQTLGVNRVTWLDAGMASDDTDGHIDTLARFAPLGVLALHVPEDPQHPDAQQLKENAERLLALDLPLVELPAPTVEDGAGGLLPVSYANFYVANGCVLVPVVGDSADALALERIGRLFPTRKVFPIHSLALFTQGGAIHCATQQVPVGSGAAGWQ